MTTTKVFSGSMVGIGVVKYFAIEGNFWSVGVVSHKCLMLQQTVRTKAHYSECHSRDSMPGDLDLVFSCVNEIDDSEVLIRIWSYKFLLEVHGHFPGVDVVSARLVESW